MKTLINKANPAIRITAPEITTEAAPYNNHQYVYWIPAINEMYNPIDWTLVEGEQTEGIKGNLEEIPSNVDIEKEYKEYVEYDPVFRKHTNRYVGLAIAKHFYELGFKGRKEK